MPRIKQAVRLSIITTLLEMTAEIALLNKEAVALAADSAVTLTLGNGQQKILPSANKIFSLSKYHPVGLMIYGNAQLVEVPWEVLVKEYRRSLGTQSFDTLEEYSTDFIKYLTKGSEFFPPEAQERSFILEARQVYDSIHQEFDERINAAAAIARAEGGAFPNEDEKTTLLDDLVSELHNSWRRMKPLSNLPSDFGVKVRERYAQTLRMTIREKFDDVQLTRGVVNKLVSIAIWAVERLPIRMRPASSGVVIAGFGNADPFAGLRSFFIGGIACDQLVYDDDRSVDVRKLGSAILPFAQHEMVSAFMEGIDSRFLNSIQDAVEEMLLGISEFAKEESGLAGARLEEFHEALARGREALADSFANRMDDVKRKNFSHPVVRVTALLPKIELASMAEALVNLTSFKRKVSEEAETVGGPIDVAVISKGDGFIWVKRKHYFTKELNPQFFANYYREEGYGNDQPQE